MHSLHAYFIRPGNPREPIVYQVDRVRDGGVVHHPPGGRHPARQADLHHVRVVPGRRARGRSRRPDAGGARAGVAADLRRADRAAQGTNVRVGQDSSAVRRALRRRPAVGDPADSGPQPGAHNLVWFRADGVLPDDDLLHVCMLAYLSDLTLLTSVLTTHALSVRARPPADGVAGPRDVVPPTDPRRRVGAVRHQFARAHPGPAGSAPGTSSPQDGRMLATVVQEGLVRLR